MLIKIFAVVSFLIFIPVVAGAQVWADSEPTLEQLYADDPAKLNAIFEHFGVIDDSMMTMKLEQLAAEVRKMVPPLDPRAAEVTEQETTIAVEDRAYISRALVWKTTNSSATVAQDGRLQIRVCFVEMPNGQKRLRDIVKTAVEATWEHYVAVDFTGWRQCSNSPGGIRIEFLTIRANSLVGTSADARTDTTMILKSGFSIFDNLRCITTAAEQCHWSIAVHEFGHALGFLHEQNREDTPDWCRKIYKDVDYADNVLATPFTKWDSNSVMNYCYDIYTRKIIPSDCDIQAARSIYGTPSSSTFTPSCKLTWPQN